MKRLLALGLLLVSAPAALADDSSKQGIFIVSEGVVRLPPDLAIIQAGVVTEGKTPEEALSKSRPAMNRVAEMVRKYGVSSADVTTSELRLSPKFTQQAASPNGQRPAPVIDGYDARTSLKIVVRDLTKSGPLVDDLVKSGSNSISSLTFALAEPTKAKDAARRKAAEAARTRALIYAEALGLQLGDLISVTETEFSPAEPTGYADMPGRKQIPGVAPTVIEPGEIEVTASVKTIWQIKK